MTQWSRLVYPRLVTPPAFPDGGESWSQSGKGQFRSFGNVGRVWQETYSAINMLTTTGRAFIEQINRSRREKLLWDIQNPHWTTNYGTGGGTPQVDGGSQSGSTLNIKSATPNITNWLRAGDIFKITGFAIIFDVKANANTDGAGKTALQISPPIFMGQSPANNTAITINAASIFFNAVLIDVEMPDIDADGILLPGMTLTFREQPS